MQSTYQTAGLLVGREWPRDPRRSRTANVCAVTLPCSVRPARAYGTVLDRVTEEFRSIEVQERLAIIINHGPSFLPSSLSSHPHLCSI